MNCPPCPKSYFQSFNDRVIAKCKEEKRQKMKSVAGNVYGRTVMGSVMSINPSVVPEKQITKKVNPVNSFQVPIYDAKLEKLFKKVPEIQLLASMINITHAEISQDIQTINRANQEGAEATQQLIDQLFERIELLEQMINDKQTLEMSAVKPVGDLEVVAERQLEEGRRMVEEVQTREKASYEMGEYFGKAQSEEEKEAMRLKHLAEQLQFRNMNEESAKVALISQFTSSPVSVKERVVNTLAKGIQYSVIRLFGEDEEKMAREYRKDIVNEFKGVRWNEGTTEQRAEKAKKLILGIYDNYQDLLGRGEIYWKGMYESIKPILTGDKSVSQREVEEDLIQHLDDPESAYQPPEYVSEDDLQEAMSELAEGEIQPAEVEEVEVEG